MMVSSRKIARTTSKLYRSRLRFATDDDEARRRLAAAPKRPAGRHPHAVALVFDLQRHALAAELVEKLARRHGVRRPRRGEESAGLVDAVHVRGVMVDVEAEGVAPAIELIRADADVWPGPFSDPSRDVRDDLL